MKLTIVIMVFNERPTILEAVNEVRKLAIDKEVIIIDNHSTDGTREILNNLNDPSLQIVYQPENLGPGGSLRTALKLAKGEYIHFFHSDLEYKASDVFKMLKKAEEESLDAVFGSRLAEKRHLSKFALIRERPYVLATLVSTYLINKWYGRSFSDVIATKLIKTAALKGLDFKFLNQGSEFELVSKLCKAGFKIGEVPVHYKPRSHKEGKKIRAMDSFPALLALLKVRFLDKKIDKKSPKR